MTVPDRPFLSSGSSGRDVEKGGVSRAVALLRHHPQGVPPGAEVQLQPLHREGLRAARREPGWEEPAEDNHDGRRVIANDCNAHNQPMYTTPLTPGKEEYSGMEQNSQTEYPK